MYMYIYIYMYIFSAASRGSATAPCHRWCVYRQKVFSKSKNKRRDLQKHLKPIKKRYQMDGKTSLERLRRQSAHLRVEGARRQSHGGRFWCPFSVRKSEQKKNICKHMKKMPPER